MVNPSRRYLDADSASGNANCGRLCTDLLARDTNDFISHDNLFRSARSVLPKIWGETYPVTELLDDLENYRPLRLYHLCQAAKLDLLRLTRSAGHSQQDDVSPQKLWENIQNFGDVCDFPDHMANKWLLTFGRNLLISYSWPS